MKRYTESEIATWICDHQCAEFVESNGFIGKTLEAVYYIHIDADGDLTTDSSNADSTITESVDITAYQDDSSPERFYNEFETLDNPAFAELVKTITDKVNECCINDALKALYDYLDMDIMVNIEQDLKSGYLTENTGRDGNDYYWYSDEHNNVAVNIKTCEVVTDDAEIDSLFC